MKRGARVVATRGEHAGETGTFLRMFTKEIAQVRFDTTSCPTCGHTPASIGTVFTKYLEPVQMELSAHG